MTPIASYLKKGVLPDDKEVEGSSSSLHSD